MIFEKLCHRAYAPFAAIPGPKPTFPFGNLLNFVFRIDRPWEVLTDYGLTYGPMSVYWTFSQPSIVLHDEKLITEVLITRRHEFYKDEPCGALIPVLTRSSPNINNGAEWERTRRQSPLTQSWIDEWFSRQMDAVRTVIRGWADSMVEETNVFGDPLLKPLRKLVFDCFSVATLGRVLPDPVYWQFMALAAFGSKRMLNPLKRPSVELPNKGVSIRQKFLKVLGDAYERVAASPDPNDLDLLSMAKCRGSELPPHELAAEMGNVFYGGCFSVPSTLVSTLYLLTLHGDEMAKVTTAVRALPNDCGLTELLNCQPLDHALREGMRLLPAVPMFGRRVLPTASTVLGGHMLPPNTNIWICNWLLQRAAPQWERPLEFIPDRWANGVAEARPLGSDFFFPEGRGPRICLGKDYSIFFMKLMLATLLKNWDIECGRGQNYDEGQRFFFGVRMPFGLRAKIKKAGQE